MPISAAVRRLVLKRAGGRCEYCQIVGWPLTVDHVVPRSLFRQADTAMKGVDADHHTNLAAACMLCNRAKWDTTAALDPLTGRTERLFNPRRDVWAEHFVWSAGHVRVVGRTPVGRATVRRLQLNRLLYQQQRRLLRAAARGGAPRWP